jgi:hypothetical protein
MDEGLKWLQTLGVGGALAGVIFYFYRKDSTEWASELIKQRDVWRDVTNAMMSVVKENSAAITANTQTIEALHRRDDRIEDALTNLGYRFPHRGKLATREDSTS